jgi:hypothetical protein
MREEAIELVAGRRLNEISNNGLRVIAGKLEISTEGVSRDELIVAISTNLGVDAQGRPA